VAGSWRRIGFLSRLDVSGLPEGRVTGAEPSQLPAEGQVRGVLAVFLSLVGVAAVLLPQLRPS
jgi:hypothetical protein